MKCKNCPYFGFEKLSNKVHAYCIHPKAKKSIGMFSIRESISSPDWCPVPTQIKYKILLNNIIIVEVEAWSEQDLNRIKIPGLIKHGILKDNEIYTYERIDDAVHTKR